MLKVYGSSDDILCVDGDIRDECGAYNAGEEYTEYIGFSDGTVLEVEYTSAPTTTPSPDPTDTPTPEPTKEVEDEDQEESVVMEDDGVGDSDGVRDEEVTPTPENEDKSGNTIMKTVSQGFLVLGLMFIGAAIFALYQKRKDKKNGKK